jgi:pyruvate,water dikinase
MRKLLEILRIIFASKKKHLLGFKERFHHFQSLLKANDEAHHLMSQMAELITSGTPFSKPYIRNIYNELINAANDIIERLMALSNGNYGELRKKLNSITSNISIIQAPRFFCPDGWNCQDYNCHECPNASKKLFEEIPYYIDIDEISENDTYYVGSKMSRLGVIRNQLQIPVPNGFSLTIRLFEEMMSVYGLRKKFDELFKYIDYSEITEVQRVCREAQELLIASPLPDELQIAIQSAYQKSFPEANPKVSVRSSAIGEDGNNHSFAGLHYTALNISYPSLLDACMEVLISKYTPQSVVYRYMTGLRDEDMPMSIAVISMVKSTISGVIYTANHVNKKDEIIIQVVKGLGTTLVSGKIKPQEYVLDKSGKIISFNPGNLIFEECALEFEGTKINKFESPVKEPLLNDIQLGRLVDYALKIENHFSVPQDIEWAIDPNGQIYILQARPLKTCEEKHISQNINQIIEEADKTHTPIIEIGDNASPGIAAGKAFIIRNLRDLKNVDKGSIIVASKNLPEFAGIIHKVKGFITNFGSTTGHLSIIAREFGVPVLTNCINATDLIKDGDEITLFSDYARVYPGKITEILDLHTDKLIEENEFIKSPLFRIWHRISKFIFKLNLTNPNSPRFKPEYCETVHDIIRFAHEYSMREMFAFYENARFESGRTYKLKFDVPLDISVINIENGLRENVDKEVITLNDIVSEPFLHLIKGMTTKGVEWSGPLSVDIKGFMNILITNINDPNKAERSIGSRSYALISNNYLNFFSRLGYHFSRLDAFAGEEQNSNFINFHFRGGAADSVRKARRARAIAIILEKLKFSVINSGDSVVANIRKIPKDETLGLLVELGRLMGAVRNTDVTMVTDKHVDIFVQAFLDGDPAPVRRFYNLG